MEVLDDFFRADAFPVRKDLVSLPVGECDQNLRRADATGNRAEHLLAFRVFLDVGQRTSTSKQIQRQIGLRAILRPRTAAADLTVPTIEIHGKLTSGHTAVPMNHRHFESDIANAVAFCCNGSREYKLHVNGTGKFVKHGPIGDCGITGRKLAVDFYGGNCKIGGGSPWTKDGTKADLSLNLLARARALSYVKEHPECPEVFCAISCRIGSPEILVVFTDRTGNELLAYRECISPDELIRHFRLREPRFAQMCRNGLFT